MPAPGNYRMPTPSERGIGTGLGTALQSAGPMAERFGQRTQQQTKWKQEQDQYKTLLETAKKDKQFVKKMETAYYHKVQNDPTYQEAAKGVPSLNWGTAKAEDAIEYVAQIEKNIKEGVATKKKEKFAERKYGREGEQFDQQQAVREKNAESRRIAALSPRHGGETLDDKTKRMTRDFLALGKMLEKEEGKTTVPSPDQAETKEEWDAYYRKQFASEKIAHAQKLVRMKNVDLMDALNQADEEIEGKIPPFKQKPEERAWYDPRGWRIGEEVAKSKEKSTGEGGWKTTPSGYKVRVKSAGM